MLGCAANGIVSGINEVVDIIVIDGIAHAFDEGVVDIGAGRIAVNFVASEIDEASGLLMWPYSPWCIIVVR